VTSLAVIDAASASLLILAFGGVAAMVLAKCTEGNNVVAWLLARRPLVALGRISYSFYLVHWMVVVLVARFASEHAQGLGPVGGSAVIFIVGFAASAMAAQISWWLVERPYFRWFAADRRAAEVVHAQSP
jgi:peptidoglycan/LPS O-acetylase OafA/YrhL